MRFLLIGIADTVALLNLYMYASYYCPLQLPLSNDSIKFLLLAAAVFVSNIVIIFFGLNKIKIKTAMLYMLIGNLIAILIFKAAVICMRNYIIYKIFKYIIPFLQKVSIRSEVIVLLCMLAYVLIAKVMLIIKNKMAQN